MAKFSFKDAVVTVNAVDLSDHISSVSLSVSSAELDTTAMGDDWMNKIGGLNDWSVSLTFQQDHAASEVDATIWPLLGTTTAVTFKPTSSATSATNPQWSGSVLVSDYSPADGSVGDLATTSVTWPGAGTLTRATS